MDRLEVILSHACTHYELLEAPKSISVSEGKSNGSWSPPMKQGF